MLLMLLFVASRAAALTALPLHNDEGLHLTRAIEVWNLHPFYAIEDGKIINVWLMALFYPQVSPVFAGRIATVFVGLIGLAAGITLARLASRRRAGGLLAGLFWIASPYLFFFERMALADIEAGAIAVLLTVALLPGLRLRRSVLIAGIALGTAILFKVSAAPFFGVPLLAMLLARDLTWRQRISRLVMIYAIALILFAPAALYSATRNGFFSIARGWIGGPALSIGERTAQNTATFLDTTLTVNGLWAVTLLGIPLSVLAGRRGIFVLGSVLGPLLVMVVLGTEVLDRHFGTVMPLLAVTAAVGWTQLAMRLPVLNIQWRRLAVVGALLMLVWAWVFAWRTAYIDPAAFPLTAPMQAQYITEHPSGYGLREAVEALPQTVGAHNVIASMSPDGCKRARYYLTPGPSLDCVGMAQGQAQIEQALQSQGVAYVLAEDVPVGLDPSTVKASWTQLAIYPRPGNITSVTVWQVKP
ncbi:MAG: hypothetical protein ABI947_28590 [Chloroflexota bacterium]